MRPEQLGPVDAAYLALDGPRTVGHVCLLLPFDSPVTHAQLRAQVSGRLPYLPELRRRLRDAPIALDRPWWVDDTHFDLDVHVRAHDLGDRPLAEAVTEIAMERLDRARPLWEVHLLQSRDGSAVLTKVHHAIADGARMRDVLNTLLGTPVQLWQEWDPEPAPSSIGMLARSAWGLGTWAWGAAVGAADALRAEPTRTIADLTAVNAPMAPATPFNKALGPNRSWAYGTWDLAASKPTRSALVVTVNDMVHAAAGAALRAWLIERDALPRRPLVALVPISTRHASEDPSGANRLAVALCEIPTHVADPTERLIAARNAMVAAKARPAMGEGTLGVLTRLFGPGLAPASALASRTRLPNRVRLPFNTVISNVPMGRDRFQVGGAVATGVYPMPPLSDGLGLNVTIQGYQGRLDVGVSACSDLVPDVERVLALMHAAYEQACGLGRRTRSHVDG
jgi:diacylglycerol O-acyltransferase